LFTHSERYKAELKLCPVAYMSRSWP